ncbi:hypothetical protein MLD38_033031 [Melastoma candidum]|uniref:Uncharacterized protein n=1 Tax=Melastoma candidum TaxID=119954 RepID=A0ACB9M828_9MYRT|nr:hypothetical protein MLD38_033031 [Melastoma candidum]
MVCLVLTKENYPYIGTISKSSVTMGMGALLLLFNTQTLFPTTLVSSVIRQPRTSPGNASAWPQSRPPSGLLPGEPLRLAYRAMPHFRPCRSAPEEEESLVEELRIPESWWVPSRASEEAEWLRVSLHKWLDDEYCPEETNVVISEVAAKAYYQSLLEKQYDLGEILLRMARDLETISYRESFHGAFSSANAAVNLIMQRIDEE